MSQQYPIMADESLMSQKGHGTTETRVIDNLRFAPLVHLIHSLLSFPLDFLSTDGDAMDELVTIFVLSTDIMQNLLVTLKQKQLSFKKLIVTTQLHFMILLVENLFSLHLLEDHLMNFFKSLAITAGLLFVTKR